MLHLFVAIISPCMALNLNKFELPLPKITFCHVWLKLAQRFWKRFSKFVNILSIFVIIFPQKKGKVLHLKETESL